MEMTFKIGNTIAMGFSMGGGTPSPQPIPEGVYSDFTPVLFALQGNITDNWEEEETNGDSGIHNS